MTSFLLDAIPLARQWPEVFAGIQDIYSWSLAHEDMSSRYELFHFASKHLQDAKDLPTVPIPSTMKWWAAIVIFLLGISGYITKIIQLIGP